MRNAITIFFLFLSINKLHCQNLCNTENVDSLSMTQLPWFGNNDWLNSFVDSIEAPFNCSNCRFG